MGKLLVKTNKVLRLSNVLIRTLEIEEDLIEFEKIIHMMDMYLKSKGAKAVGPFIQYTDHIVNEDGTVKTRIQFMLQSDNYISHVDYPYSMRSTVRVENCYYLRFTGEESKMNIAYNKLAVEAYENDEILNGDSYTIFLGNCEGDITVDIFMEKKI